MVNLQTRWKPKLLRNRWNLSFFEWVVFWNRWKPKLLRNRRKPKLLRLVENLLSFFEWVVFKIVENLSFFEWVVFEIVENQSFFEIVENQSFFETVENLSFFELVESLSFFEIKWICWKLRWNPKMSYATRTRHKTALSKAWFKNTEDLFYYILYVILILQYFIKLPMCAKENIPLA
jgi:hypothetical protein